MGDRLDLERREQRVHIERLQEEEQAALSEQQVLSVTLSGINREIKDTEKAMQFVLRQLEGGVVSKAPRPPKHAGTRTMIDARERRFAAGVCLNPKP